MARASEIQEQLLQEAGGTWSVSEVAGHLDISRQAVDQRRRRGTLLAPTLRRSPSVEAADDQGMSIIDALRAGRVEEALHAARASGRHGAA